MSEIKIKDCKVEKRIHKVWQELEDARNTNPSFKVEHLFEKYQYLYSKDDNVISLVQFTKRMYSENCWEICQVDGKEELFEDVERFTTKDKAEHRIKELFK